MAAEAVIDDVQSDRSDTKMTRPLRHLGGLWLSRKDPNFNPNRAAVRSDTRPAVFPAGVAIGRLSKGDCRGCLPGQHTHGLQVLFVSAW